MILNIVVILGTLGIAFAWSSKARGYGFFSALVALACVISAGAIAFGLWETTVHAGLFPLADGDGFIANLARDNAWGIGLLAPFVIALLVLRLIADRFVRANLEMSNTANLVGGGLVGLAIGGLTMGVVVIGLGHMRLGASLFGHKPIAVERGNMVYESPLWVPVDAAAANLYETMSVGSFSTGTPMARYRPDPHVSAGLMRMTFDDKARTTLLPDDVDVLGRYVISGTLGDILTDRWQPAKQQNPLTIRGEDPEPGSNLQGYILTFGPGAKEASGNVILTSGQVQLLVEHQGETERLLPIALIERTAGGSLALARFRFDAEGTAATSVGGAADSVFAFEFLVPPGAETLHMFVKGVRKDLDDLTETTLASTDMRDEAITDETIFSPFGISAAGTATADIDESSSQTVQRTDRGGFPGVDITDRLPLNVRLQSSTVRGRMQLTEDNHIISGRGEFDEGAMAPRDAERSLVVDRFATPDGTEIVQLDIATDGRESIFGRALDAAERVAQPRLVDTNGVSYAPIGYVFREGGRVEISIDPASPVRSISQLPELARTRQQSLVLIFAPDEGTTIDGYVLGNREVQNFGDEGLEVR